MTQRCQYKTGQAITRQGRTKQRLTRHVRTFHVPAAIGQYPEALKPRFPRDVRDFPVERGECFADCVNAPTKPPYTRSFRVESRECSAHRDNKGQQTSTRSQVQRASARMLREPRRRCSILSNRLSGPRKTDRMHGAVGSRLSHASHKLDCFGSNFRMLRAGGENYREENRKKKYRKYFFIN